MLNTVSLAGLPQGAPNIVLRRIWKVKADSTYDIIAGTMKINVYVALRTVSGSGELLCDGKRSVLTPDTLMIVRHNDISTYKTLGNHWNFYWFEFTCDDYEFPMNECFPVIPAPNEFSSMDLCFIDLAFPNENTYISCVFSAMLLYWLHFYRRNDFENDGAVRYAVNYILQHIGEEIDLAQIARDVNMTDRYFRKIFHVQVGKSPQQFISDLRITAAKNYLNSTSLPIKTISASLGFRNQYYFSTFFKEKYGCSPIQYRKQFYSTQTAPTKSEPPTEQKSSEPIHP